MKNFKEYYEQVNESSEVNEGSKTKVIKVFKHEWAVITTSYTTLSFDNEFVRISVNIGYKPESGIAHSFENESEKFSINDMGLIEEYIKKIKKKYSK